MSFKHFREWKDEVFLNWFREDSNRENKARQRRVSKPISLLIINANYPTPNTNSFNSIIHKSDNIQWVTWVHPKNVQLVQCYKICQCNLPCKQFKEKSHRTFFTDPVKKLMKPSVNYDNKGYVKNSNIRYSEHHTKLGKIENRWRCPFSPLLSN